MELTPEFIVVCAALCLSTAVPHLTTVLFIVYSKTEVLSLEYTQEVQNVNHASYIASSASTDLWPGSILT